MSIPRQYSAVLHYVKCNCMLLQYRANTLCQYAPIQRVLTLYLVPIQRVLIQLQYRANTALYSIGAKRPQLQHIFYF